ncbi:MAG TPA: choice-of-anchor Q domain-containing protein, partial [Nocardioidaceae bacterium]|nr:choice-of-anchor Q domain-containing protein [Nocardioidaceae bacterium]
DPGRLAIDPFSSILVVTKGFDTLDGACDHDCSLREAVSAANARLGPDVILLGERVHTLTRAGRGEDANATGDLDVLGSLVILGAGAGRTMIDGGAVDRILHTPDFGSPLEIHGVTLRNGDAQSVNFSGGDGGAVLANTLTLVASHVTGNRSAGGGGGIHSSSLLIRDSTVSNNQAAFFGGGIESRNLSLSNVTVSGNRVEHFGGGLVFIDHQIDGATVTGNSAGEQGGGIFISSPDCPSDGTICEPAGSIRHSVIAGNQAPQNRDCVGMESPQSGYNVFGVDEEFGCAAGATDLAGTPASPLDPKLTALGDHGGPTPTHSLLADSPAVDLGPAAGCLPLDQRGRMRPADGDLDGSVLCDAGAVERLPACQPDATTLCLGAGDRFRVAAHWTARGEEGDARAIPLTPDTGSFWFFSPANVELTLKVLDGCAVNDRFWVFVSGLTDVDVDILVEDFVTGKTWLYSNPAGTIFQPRLDTGAFDICPEG